MKEKEPEHELSWTPSLASRELDESLSEVKSSVTPGDSRREGERDGPGVSDSSRMLSSMLGIALVDSIDSTCSRRNPSTRWVFPIPASPRMTKILLCPSERPRSACSQEESPQKSTEGSDAEKSKLTSLNCFSSTALPSVLKLIPRRRFDAFNEYELSMLRRMLSVLSDESCRVDLISNFRARKIGTYGARAHFMAKAATAIIRSTFRVNEPATALTFSSLPFTLIGLSSSK